jgi:hypothetical protein
VWPIHLDVRVSHRFDEANVATTMVAAMRPSKHDGVARAGGPEQRREHKQAKTATLTIDVMMASQPS